MVLVSIKNELRRKKSLKNKKINKKFEEKII
jgi:hypothetical protein